MAERPKMDRARVGHVARLASLSLDGREVDAMVVELARIVAYVDKLGELDTENVPPTTSMTASSSLRPDEVQPGLSHADALRQAPHAVSGGFAVPRFLDAPRTGR
jgi:aspartyl-tRNA(Asn)/glutamyl-tRNA(Gln) amidotransferase subunit C